MKPKLYFASPLFSEAELNFNKQTAEMLDKTFTVYLPQRDGGLMARMVQSGLPSNVAADRVFQMDIELIEDCDVLLAVLDGRSVDEGVSFELGYAFSRNKLCIGLQTDVRRLMPTGNNPMISQALSRVFSNSGELEEWSKIASSFFLRTGSFSGFRPAQPLVG